MRVVAAAAVAVALVGGIGLTERQWYMREEN